MTFAEFDQNTMALDAVIRNFEIMGEAGNNIPISIQKAIPSDSLEANYFNEKFTNP
jgi:uncharacterized protein with HEPN domain